jgi:hypothetical protein
MCLLNWYLLFFIYAFFVLMKFLLLTTLFFNKNSTLFTIRKFICTKTYLDLESKFQTKIKKQYLHKNHVIVQKNKE